MKKINRTVFVIAIIVIGLAVVINFSCQPKTSTEHSDKKSVPQNYSTCNSFDDLINATDINYFEPVRVSPVGTKNKPLYHGFFYYNHTQTECLQFEPSGRYLLGMRIFIEGREVQPTDLGEIGMFDLHNKNKWIKIGETTTWNWQQGCRLQWVPGFEEIIWNARSEDGKGLLSKIYNINTKKTRTLPFPAYVISPDGKKALSVNNERIFHRGCKYPGIEDPYKDQWAPANIGVWEMGMKSGELKLILSLRKIAKVMFPDGLPADTTGNTLFIFRIGFNPSGNRIIVFVKDARDYKYKWGLIGVRTEGYSMNRDGSDIKYFYKEPSHHFWFNDNEIVDNGLHVSPDGKVSLGYYRFMDDGSGQAKEKLFDAPNGHISISKNGEWILTDASGIDGYQYLYLYHMPTRKIVPLAKLELQIGGYRFTTGLGALRVDLHPRFSFDNKTISFDSTHEGFGRQIYIMDISSIIDNPPK